MEELTLLELLEKFGREVVHLENTSVTTEKKDQGVKEYAKTYRGLIIKRITENL